MLATMLLPVGLIKVMRTGQHHSWVLSQAACSLAIIRRFEARPSQSGFHFAAVGCYAPPSNGTKAPIDRPKDIIEGKVKGLAGSAARAGNRIILLRTRPVPGWPTSTGFSSIHVYPVEPRELMLACHVEICRSE